MIQLLDVLLRVSLQPAQSLSDQASSEVGLTCRQYVTTHLGEPSRYLTSLLRFCQSDSHGCCIRLASSLAANCMSARS
eukprot:6491012-Amphidinium_carterae.2